MLCYVKSLFDGYLFLDSAPYDNVGQLQVQAQASQLLEALECPVCLETADEEPIYQVLVKKYM